MMQYKRHFWLIGLGLCLIALGWGLEPTKAANDESVERPFPPPPTPITTSQQAPTGSKPLANATFTP